MLELRDIQTFYGLKQVLFGVSLTIGSGEVVTLMGRNGMGKTTTIRSIIGFTPAAAGSIRLDGNEIRLVPPYRIARAGIGLVPEGRQIFPNLTVHENLVATAHIPAGTKSPWTASEVYDLFPRLAERKTNWGWQLSGGEQQMLAIGRALMTNPRLLILDEATEGIAPLIRQEIWQCLDRVKALGQSILVVDKNLDALLKLADRHYMIEKGTIAWHGTSEDLRAAPDVYERYLGV
jgi:branched-chain amino acid transport system ATP-binding protein